MPKGAIDPHALHNHQQQKNKYKGTANVKWIHQNGSRTNSISSFVRTYMEELKVLSFEIMMPKET